MKQNKSKLGLSILLSLLLHGLATLVLVLNPAFDPSQFTPTKVTEVELIDPEELLKSIQRQKDLDGQIVEQSEKPINDEIPENARFLSRHNQKVIRETQAAHRGKFKNSDGTKGAATSPIKERLQADASQETFRDPHGVKSGKKPNLKDLMPSFKPLPPPPDSETRRDLANGNGDGPSTTDDHLKNVEVGMQTLLSSREFVYYSYYNRIKDKLRQYWEPKIKEKVERIIRQGRTIASDTDRITRIVIVLDKNGTLLKVQVIGPSGVKDLDDAAVEAFRAAAPFPNPPKGMIDADGTIKIRWDFILEASSSNIFNAIRLARIPQ